MKGLKIDSFVEEITNSSTVIYTWANSNAKQIVRQFLSDVLIDAEYFYTSDKNVDDLYEIKVVPKDIDQIVELLMEQEDEIGEDGEENFENSEEREQRIRNIVNKMIEEGNDFSDSEFENYMGFTPSTTIIVTSKITGKQIDLSTLFSSDGGRDG